MKTQSDVAVQIKATENVTETVDNIKKSIHSLDTENQILKRTEQAFDRITGSGKNMKSQLNKIKLEMANLSAQGKEFEKSEIFLKMNQEASRLYDLLGDAQNQIALMADDDATLKSVTMGFNLMASSVQTLTGFMGLFGNESEKMQRLTQKTIQLIAITNGLQQVQAMLNKDSIMMLKLKAWWQNIKNTVEEKSAVSTAKDTASTAGNTLALTANLGATKIWNFTKAISKALLGDFTGLLIVGGGALLSYALFTDNSTKAQEAQNEALKKAQDEQKRYSDTVSSTFANLMGKYTRLQIQWKNLKTEHEKNQWITDNKNAFNELGVSIQNINDAENVFVNNTQKMVESFTQRAEQTAKFQKMVDNYKQLEDIDQKVSKVNKKVYVKAGQVTGDDDKKLLSRQYGQFDKHDRWVFTEEGAKKRNQELRYQEVKDDLKKKQELLKDNERLQNDMMKFEQKNSSYKANTHENTTPSTTPITHVTQAKTKAIEAIKGSLADLEKQLQDAQNRQKTELFKANETKESLSNLINDLQSKIKDKKIELGIELSDSEKLKQEADKKTKDLQDKLNNITLKFDPFKDVSSFDKAANKLPSKIEIVQRQMNYLDGVKEKLIEIQQEAMKLNNFDLFGDATNKILDVNSNLQTLSDTVKSLSEVEVKKEDKIDAFDTITEASGNLQNAFMSLGNAFSSTADKSTKANLMMVSSVLQGVNASIPAIMKLIGLKIVEGKVVATTSVLHQPFPLNMISLVSVLATLTSVFANITNASQHFERGGIVGGNSFTGDNVHVALNSREMVLTTGQQARLFNILDGREKIQNNNISGGNVHFIIKGSDLYGTLQNYERINNLSI